ncbi:chromosome segregation protein SMC [Candidatus Woesearchaeota archaeon]|nr:chromosome segregation protein SMC [Candidatus Woesearchaeota archaeon]
MTRISKLVLHGFKSFAKRTELLFDDNFSVILGPNGSGKSNILDSLCFVLGRISSKELRTEKLAHLIYNGGKTKQPAAKAEVSIFFDNSKKVFPYPEQMVKVSRIIKPTGQSSYRINDKASTRQEILDLLALAKIDPDGHNIVLQGDIVRFVEMSSEERRQVIEEIAGISVYEDKKNKALSELQKVDERLKEADILLSERKAHLKELKHDRDQALKYRELNDRVRSNKATYLNLQIRQREAKKSEVEKGIAASEKDIAGLKAEIGKLRLAVVKRKEEISQLNEELEHKAEQEQVTIHRNIEQIRVAIGTNANRISLDDGEIVKVRERREQLKIDLSELESRVSQLEESKRSLAAQVQKLSADRERLEASIQKLRGSVDSADLVRIEAELGAIDKEVEEKQLLMQSMVEQKQNLLREKDRLEFRINTIDSSMEKLKVVEKESKNEIDELQQRRNDFKKVVLELNQLLAKDSMVSAKLGENRKRISALSEEVAKARAKEAAVQERVLGNLAVKSVLSQKSIRGVHGTVSQLGKAKAKYALALEVAAGPRINSIIVESDAVAAECISFLKSKRIGTASFLPLNKIRQAEGRSDIAGLLKLPGVHGLAISLISFDERFKPAFSYVFGSTIAVDSIEVARKIGIGRARMVSLDGDLAELSGAMHGGYRERRAESTSFLDEEETLVAGQLEHKLAALAAETTGLEQEKETAEAAIASLREKKAALEGDIIKMERSLHLESSDVDVSKKQKQELQEELKSVISKLREAEDRLLGQTRLVAELKSRRMQAREQIASLRNPAFLAELNAFDKRKQELSEQIQRSENESRTIEVQLNEVFSQEKAKLLQILKQLGKDEEHFSAEKDRLVKETEKLRKDLSESEAKAAKFQARHKELFASRTKLMEEVQADDEKIIRKEEQINSAEIRINNISIKKAEVSAELAGLNEEFSQYADVKLLEGVSEDQIKGEISRFERLVIEMGNVNLKALEIYDDVEKQYSELLDKKDKLAREKDDVLKMINEIEGRKKDLFMNSFTVLNQNFARIFSQLSTKGEAHLVIENEEKLFEAGVRIRVRLAGEKFLDIRSLSGGEKTLTALALIFAIQEYEPASFYIIDEVDAALDKRNSELLAKLLKSYSAKAQYIAISHNDAIMSEGESLYGVSMDENGMSNVVSLKV